MRISNSRISICLIIRRMIHWRSLPTPDIPPVKSITLVCQANGPPTVNSRKHGGIQVMVWNCGRPAPLFDHNMGLFKNDMRADWEAGRWTPETLDQLQPSNSAMTFMRQVLEIMGDRQHEWLRHALDVNLEEDPQHPMEPGRIETLNNYLHATTRRLLAIPVVYENTLSAQLDEVAVTITHAPVVRNEAWLNEYPNSNRQFSQ